MGLIRLISALKRAVAAVEDIELQRSAHHRLEIEHRELREYVSQLAGHHLKLRKQFDGSKGGRPVSRSATPALDEVPFGDKAALRKALGIVPRPHPDQENSH